MQSIEKLVKGASPLVALLFVVMTSFSGGLLITMANGSASPLFSCEVIKGIGNTTLTNASLLEGAGKVPLGLKCSGTKSQTQTVTNGVKSNSVKSSSSGKPSTNGSAPSPFFSCDAVKGTGNTKLTIPSLLQGAARTVHFGLNCKTAGVLLPATPKAKGGPTNGFRWSGNGNNNSDNHDVTKDCTVGNNGCVAISCSSGGQTVPCINHEGKTVTSCYWDSSQAVNACEDGPPPPP